MEKSNVFFTAMFASTLAAMPALAAGDACVQNNRTYSTRVIDSSTILVTDLDKKQYIVHMRGTSIDLDKNALSLSFRTKTELGCLTSGDSISYNRPGERTRVSIRGSLQTPCFVDSVMEGAPPTDAG
jgi:hypothetical protein